MPLDAGGTFRHNHESAAMHSKADGKEYKPEGKPDPENGGEHTEVHNHGDGTFHTVHGGEQVDHESIGHMHAHLSKIHGEEGHKHFHAHHDGMAMHTHSASSDQEPEHRDHEDVEGAHQHMDEAMGDQEQMGEPDGDEQMASAAPAGKGLSGLY